MRIWKETAAVSAAALLGVFLLPLADELLRPTKRDDVKFRLG